MIHIKPLEAVAAAAEFVDKKLSQFFEQENFIGGTERDRAIIDAPLTVFHVSHLHSEDPWQSEERLHTA